MSLRRLELLQWVGLFLGGAAWAAQLVVGYGYTEASCGTAHLDGVPNDTWQAVAMAASGLLIVAALAAAVGVLRRTRDVSYDGDGPPLGRVRFFAIAAVAANFFFLMIVLLSGIASIAAVGCMHA